MDLMEGTWLKVTNFDIFIQCVLLDLELDTVLFIFFFLTFLQYFKLSKWDSFCGGRSHNDIYIYVY